MSAASSWPPLSSSWKTPTSPMTTSRVGDAVEQKLQIGRRCDRDGLVGRAVDHAAALRPEVAGRGGPAGAVPTGARIGGDAGAEYEFVMGLRRGLAGSGDHECGAHAADTEWEPHRRNPSDISVPVRRCAVAAGADGVDVRRVREVGRDG